MEKRKKEGRGEEGEGIEKRKGGEKKKKKKGKYS